MFLNIGETLCCWVPFFLL